MRRQAVRGTCSTNDDVHLQLIFSICWHFDSARRRRATQNGTFYSLRLQRLRSAPSERRASGNSLTVFSQKIPPPPPPLHVPSPQPASWPSVTLTKWLLWQQKASCGGEMNPSLTLDVCVCAGSFRCVFFFFSLPAVRSETPTSSPLDEFVRKEALILMASIDFLQVQSGALSASNQWLDTTLHFLVANTTLSVVFVHSGKDLRNVSVSTVDFEAFFLCCFIESCRTLGRKTISIKLQNQWNHTRSEQTLSSGC